MFNTNFLKNIALVWLIVLGSYYYYAYMTYSVAQSNYEKYPQLAGWQEFLNTSTGQLERLGQPQEVVPKGQTVYISECNCSKMIHQFNAFPSNWSFKEEDSTCSSASYLRGPGQKVIGFSYFHPSEAPDLRRDNKFGRKYFEGIGNNTKAMKKHYPGHVLRLYFRIGPQFTGAWEKLCDLACTEEYIDICQINLSPPGRSFMATMLKHKGINVNFDKWPMTWRFLPVVDPTVDLFFSRDLDSLISEREVAAVEEFMQSETSKFHVMRDHPDHGSSILGGTWGVKVNESGNELQSRMMNLFRGLDRQHDVVAYDQSVMRNNVWPWAKSVVMAHDAYFCNRYEAQSRPFPTQRPDSNNNFVGGSPYGRMKFTLNRTVCPAKCRPKEHQDWTHC